MWSVVEAQLINILSGKIYPQLLTDPGYRILLFEAGLIGLPGVQSGQPVNGQFTAAQNAWYQGKPMQNRPNVPATAELTLDQRRRLHAVAELRACLMVMEIKDLECLVEKGAEATRLTHKGSIYRVWDAKSGNQTRHWWFTENLKNKAVSESKRKGIPPGEWIRNALAISLDFGKCDRLSRIDMKDLRDVPAIIAKGLPMPQRTKIYRRPDGVTVGQADDDYWQRLGKQYTGNHTQLFLPYLPPEAIKPDAWN